MKKGKYEIFGRLMRQYHRSHPWRLDAGGLYVPHLYDDPRNALSSLSWWDDVGFILGGRRVIVWWQHPRQAYADDIDARIWEEAGPGPRDQGVFDGATKNYRRVGASRKRVVSIACRPPSDVQRQYYDRLHDIRGRLMAEGIEASVAPSWQLERLTWAMGVALIAPLEVRTREELAAVALLARRLMRRETTLEQAFPGYRYGREDWLRERPRMQVSKTTRTETTGNGSVATSGA